MCNPLTMTDVQLTFVVRDCYEAIGANPQSDNVHRYLRDAEACKAEQGRRMSRRALRSGRDANAPYDDMGSVVSVRPRERRWRRHSADHYAMRQRKWLDCLYSLAWRKLEDRKLGRGWA